METLAPRDSGFELRYIHNVHDILTTNKTIALQFHSRSDTVLKLLCFFFSFTVLTNQKSVNQSKYWKWNCRSICFPALTSVLLKRVALTVMLRRKSIVLIILLSTVLSVKWSVFFKLLTYMGLHKLNIYILVTEVCYLTLKFPRFCGLSAQLLVFQ